MPFNEVADLDLEVDGLFPGLEQLDLSYNNLTPPALIVLATLPSLQTLDLTANNIVSLPRVLVGGMQRWREAVIELLLPGHVAFLDAAVKAAAAAAKEEEEERVPRPPVVGVGGGFVRRGRGVEGGVAESFRLKEVAMELQGGSELPEFVGRVGGAGEEDVGLYRGGEGGDVGLSGSGGGGGVGGDGVVMEDKEVVVVTVDESTVREVHTVTDVEGKHEDVGVEGWSESGSQDMRSRMQSPSLLVPSFGNGAVRNVVAFEGLENLVLERNGLASAESLSVLGSLPKLKKLNLNYNKYRTLQFLSSHQPSANADSPPPPFLVQKYNGFHALEELRIAFNKIDSVRGLFGMVWLPAIKCVWVQGNPVMVRVGKEGGGVAAAARNVALESNDDELISYTDCDPLKLLPAIYGIQILDLCYQPHPSVLDDTYYALTNPASSTASGAPAATSLRKMGGPPQQILPPGGTGPAGTLRRIVRPSHHLHVGVGHDDLWNPVNPLLPPATNLVTHKVEEAVTVSLEELKTRRRGVKLTDEQVRETVRQGRVLTLKELRRIKKREDGVEEGRRREREMVEGELVRMKMEEERRRVKMEGEVKMGEGGGGVEEVQVVSLVGKERVVEAVVDVEPVVNRESVPVQVQQEEPVQQEEMKYDPSVQDQTFITGVHITGGGNNATTTQEPIPEPVPEPESSHEDQPSISPEPPSILDLENDEMDASQENPPSHHPNHETDSSSDSFTSTNSTLSFDSTAPPPHLAHRLHNPKHTTHPTAARAAEHRRQLARTHNLPRTIQSSLRALRHALSNPISYWRVLEDSYAKPTFAHTVRVRENERKAGYVSERASETLRREEEEEDEFDAEMKEMRMPNRESASNKGDSETSSMADANMVPESGNVSPANTMWTTVAVKFQAEREAAIVAATRAAKNLTNATSKNGNLLTIRTSPRHHRTPSNKPLCLKSTARDVKSVAPNTRIDAPHILGEFRDEDAMILAEILGKEHLKKRISVMNESNEDDDASQNQQQLQQQQAQVPPQSDERSSTDASDKGKSALLKRLEKERQDQIEGLKREAEADIAAGLLENGGSSEHTFSPRKRMTPNAAVVLAEKRAAEYKRKMLESKHVQLAKKKFGAKKIRYKDEFEDMNDMMSAVDAKIATIETNLASILNSNIMQKHMPQSRKLMNEVQAEYKRIDAMYRESALTVIEASKQKK
ncbi:hypothetical protein HDU98_004910 [Podochytrium sp. JEL0797]|nr:hypothetical protein HDU98_004910 [Podochytrium sp. JEL0797]